MKDAWADCDIDTILERLDKIEERLAEMERRRDDEEELARGEDN